MLKERLQECFKARSDITLLGSIGSDSMLISTKLHGVKILSTNDASVTHNLSIELLGYKTTALALSSEHNLFAFANAKVIYILNLTNKTILQSIHTDEGEIELLAFVEKSSYLIAGTKEGRISQYRFDSKAQLSRLCSFPHKNLHNYPPKKNYISAVAFYGDYMACSGYGGGVVLLKISSIADKKFIDSSGVRINTLVFLDKEHLLAGGGDGELKIHSLLRKKKPKSIRTPFTSVKKILPFPKSHFALISGDSSKIALIDTANAKLLSSNYLAFEADVVDMALDSEGRLYVALKSGTLYRYEFATAKELRSHILHNSLDVAFKLVEDDSMLQNTHEHKRLEAIYERLFAEALEDLSQSQTQKVKELLEIFKDVKSKHSELTTLFSDFKNYPRFKVLVEQKSYILAFAMSEKFGSLKKTLAFKELESHFKEAFSAAQKQMLLGKESLAKELLLPYMGAVNKKPLINLLLKQNRDFIDFLRAIEDKEYLKVEKLSKKNALFLEIPSYKSLLKKRQETLEDIRAKIYKSETKNAITMIETLHNIPSLKEELTELYNSAKLVEELHEYYEKSDFIACYELLDAHYELSQTQLSELLERHWSKLMRECEELALSADYKGIKERLAELIMIKSRRAKIGDLLRVSFHSKIKALLAKRSFSAAENILYSYIDIFGIDSELRTLMKIYEKLTHKKLAITLEQERALSRDSWVETLFKQETPSAL